MARIFALDTRGASLGTGTLVAVSDYHGLVITNWHVVRDARGAVLVQFPDGFASPATILKVDRDWDLAALAIWRPRVKPVVIATEAPRPGEILMIAGYGSGDYRISYGPCTKYLSPSPALPAELVELRAAARRGDSGGPIFNTKGELAGVLFGSDGSTVGSYCGRVRAFLYPLRDAFLKLPPPDPLLAQASTLGPPVSTLSRTAEESSAGTTTISVSPSQSTASIPLSATASPNMPFGGNSTTSGTGYSGSGSSASSSGSATADQTRFASSGQNDYASPSSGDSLYRPSTFPATPAGGAGTSLAANDNQAWRQVDSGTQRPGYSGQSPSPSSGQSSTASPVAVNSSTTQKSSALTSWSSPQSDYSAGYSRGGTPSYQSDARPADRPDDSGRSYAASSTSSRESAIPGPSSGSSYSSYTSSYGSKPSSYGSSSYGSSPSYGSYSDTSSEKGSGSPAASASWESSYASSDRYKSSSSGVAEDTRGGYPASSQSYESYSRSDLAASGSSSNYGSSRYHPGEDTYRTRTDFGFEPQSRSEALTTRASSPARGTPASISTESARGQQDSSASSSSERWNDGSSNYQDPYDYRSGSTSGSSSSFGSTSRYSSQSTASSTEKGRDYSPIPVVDGQDDELIYARPSSVHQYDRAASRGSTETRYSYNPGGRKDDASERREEIPSTSSYRSSSESGTATGSSRTSWGNSSGIGGSSSDSSYNTSRDTDRSSNHWSGTGSSYGDLSRRESSSSWGREPKAISGETSSNSGGRAFGQGSSGSGTVNGSPSSPGEFGCQTQDGPAASKLAGQEQEVTIASKSETRSADNISSPSQAGGSTGAVTISDKRDAQGEKITVGWETMIGVLGLLVLFVQSMRWLSLLYDRSYYRRRSYRTTRRRTAWPAPPPTAYRWYY